MRIAVQGEVSQVVERLATAIGADVARANVAPQHLRNFEIEKVRGTKGLAGIENPLADPRRGCGLKENFEDRRGIYDDQRFILSARTAAAGAGRGCTGCRPASLALISSRVGRSRDDRSSRSRYSDNDIPSNAARALRAR
jgi:hypothetical protein